MNDYDLFDVEPLSDEEYAEWLIEQEEKQQEELARAEYERDIEAECQYWQRVGMEEI